MNLAQLARFWHTTSTNLAPTSTSSFIVLSVDESMRLVQGPGLQGVRDKIPMNAKSESTTESVVAMGSGDIDRQHWPVIMTVSLH